MKKIIKKVLDRHQDSQGNMASESFRDMLAVEIACNIAEEAKENRLTIQMWKGYRPENENQMEFIKDEVLNDEFGTLRHRVGIVEKEIQEIGGNISR